MAGPSKRALVRALLDRHGRTFADELRPFADRRALRAAARLGLGSDVRALARLARGDREFARLAAALVRMELEKDFDGVREQAAAR